MEPENNKKWYQKKRYYLPLAVFGIFIIIGLSSKPTDNATPRQTQNNQTQQQVKSDTVTIPAYQQPLKVIQEQPTSTNQQQVIPPAQSQQPAPTYYITSAGSKSQTILVIVRGCI